MRKQDFPPGWNEERVREVIDYYDRQSEEEELAEFEASFEASGETTMSVPTELVPVVVGLVEAHRRHTVNREARRRNAKARPKKGRKSRR